MKPLNRTNRNATRHLLSKLIAAAVLAVLLILSCIPSVAAAQMGTATVYLSASGSDSGAGTESSPYATLSHALNVVSDGGTITVVGTYAPTSSFTWSAHGKTVTVTGGTLNFANVGSKVLLGDNVRFENVTLTFASGAALYANGHTLTIAETATLTELSTPITVYGGGTSGTTVTSTNVTLLSGTYTRAYGGSNGGTVTGDTHLTVGGNVNPNLDIKVHASQPYFFGGGLNDTIKGNTNVTFTGNAKAMQIFGGSAGANSKIEGTLNTFITGGSTMGMYGGNLSVDTGKSISLTMTAGYAEQVFGGSSGIGYTGNVTVRVLGGEVGRRVYGGCYNEVTRSGLSFKWESSYYVNGIITLMLGGSNTVSMNATDSSGSAYNDESIYARSRQKTKSSTEKAILIYTDEAGYTSHKSKLKATDFAMQLIMSGGPSAADETHYYTYSANDTTDIITQTCGICSTSHSATATLSIDSAVPLTYTGESLTPTLLTYSGTWGGDPLTVTYADNVGAGNATATAAHPYNGTAVFLNFTIVKAPQSAPSLGKTDETVKGKADGTITGLTTAMEYTTDGVTYLPVTDPSILLAAGTYSVRFAETDNYLASPVTALTIEAGRPLTVTFQAKGMDDVVVEVEWMGSVPDLPELPSSTDYAPAKPFWSVTDLTDLTTDVTVTASYPVDIKEVNLALTDSLILNYYAAVEETVLGEYTLGMTFTVNGITVTVESTGIDEAGQYVFALKEIAPQLMAEKVNAALVLLNGEDEIVATLDRYDGYSVKTYLLTLLNTNPSAELTALIHDLLAYGAAAQSYLDMENTVSADVTLTPSHRTPEESGEIVENQNGYTAAEGTTQFVGMGVWFDYVNRPYVLLYVADGDLDRIDYEALGASAEELILTANDEGGALYRIDLAPRAPLGYDTPLQLTLRVDGMDRQVMTFTVNRYVYEVCQSETEQASVKALAKALYNYGVSAEEYSAAPMK